MPRVPITQSTPLRVTSSDQVSQSWKVTPLTVAGPPFIRWVAFQIAS
jgi:hypothetical protein